MRLTHVMVRALAERLVAWADDAAVTRVIVLAAERVRLGRR